MENRFELSHLKLIVDTVFDANNPTIMGTQFTQLLVSALGVKAASVFVVNPGKDALEILATEGLSINYLNKGPILTDQSIRLPDNLKPVIITDTRNSDRLQYPKKAEEEGIRSIVSLPVNLRGKIIGALRVYHSEPWQVSERDLATLNLLTRYLGMALRYFRLATAVNGVKDTIDDIHPIWL
ncbi:MAG TPA: GAF domain-containing protein [Desulfobacteraceae bacterium]|nr:GAF domain-containing protein [Desulfobacteraceae bacterium]